MTTYIMIKTQCKTDNGLIYSSHDLTQPINMNDYDFICNGFMIYIVNTDSNEIEYKINGNETYKIKTTTFHNITKSFNAVTSDNGDYIIQHIFSGEMYRIQIYDIYYESPTPNLTGYCKIYKIPSDDADDYTNELMFEGELVKGLRNGDGTSYSGGKNKGMWVNDTMNGIGKSYRYTCGNVVIYDGMHNSGALNGYGKMIVNDRLLYEGLWENGNIVDYGTLCHDNVKWVFVRYTKLDISLLNI